MSVSKPSITILEAREACSGATGRNGGHIRPDIFNGAASRMRKHGLRIANEVAHFELENAEALAHFIKSEGIDCDFTAVTTSAAFGGRALKHVTYYGAEDVERASGVRGAVALYTFPAAVVWPYKMVMHLLAAAVVGAGAKPLDSHVGARRVSPEADGEGYWTLERARGTVKAKTCRLRDERVHERPAARPGIGVPAPMAASSSAALLVIGISQRSGRATPMIDDASLIEPAVPFFQQWAGKNLVGWEGVDTRIENV
ncbi:hypothetical protein F4802DRAFT_598871 [Xylaria palmicola]|nr:hypothetical protein F4802DRAFT_598871 [Xylaria palmicola]